MTRVLGSDPGQKELAHLVDSVFASYARYWAESFRLARLPETRVAAGIRYEGFHHIEKGLSEGHGVILALPHLGGWEWAGTDLAMRGFPITVVAERVEPPDLFEWFVTFRGRLGMKVIPTGPGAAWRCSRALADNHVLCLLCDRRVGDSSGVKVEFFGEETELPGGPAMLSLRSGAPLLPVGVYFGRDAHDHIGRIGPPIDPTRTGRLRTDVGRVTQELAHRLEQLIRLDPTQWHMLQPNWPSDPGPEGCRIAGETQLPRREDEPG
jgi:KDO2-lipid IV(A) lauroyltransferase